MTEVNQAFINTSYSAFFQLAKANKQEEEDEAESKRQLGKDISTYFDMQKRKEKKKERMKKTTESRAETKEQYLKCFLLAIKEPVLTQLNSLNCQVETLETFKNYAVLIYT